MAPLAVCSGLPLVLDGRLGAPAFVRFAIRGSSFMSFNYNYVIGSINYNYVIGYEETV